MRAWTPFLTMNPTTFTTIPRHFVVTSVVGGVAREEMAPATSLNVGWSGVLPQSGVLILTLR